MYSHKTSGIVLKSINYSEADKILTIFTERFGKVKVIAKGIRRIKSHLAGSLEPFMIVDLQLHEGKTFYIVTGAVIKSEFSGIGRDLKKTARAFFLGELVDKFLEEGQKSVEIFELFSQALEEIDLGLPGPLIQAFELKIIAVSGFRPELYNCIHCKNKITPGDNFWDDIEGGLICEDCKSIHRHGKSISDNAIKLLRFIQDNSSAQTGKIKVNLAVELEIDALISRYIESILEHELKSQRFLNAMNSR